MKAEAAAVYLVAINVIAFVAYGVDKYKARRGMWRIKESTLLLLAAVGGAAGAYAGMRVFRHKTRHARFKILVPLCLAIWILGIWYFVQMK